MLKPKYIERLPAAMVELYSEVEQDILADMARRIAAYDYWIPAAEHQRKALIELGNFHSYVIKALSARTGKTTAELERLMEEAGMKALSFDVAVYREHGLDPPPLAASKELQKVLRAGLRQTSGLFVNLSRTTANTASKQFEDALDRAWLQISSGAFDSNTAIRMAVKDLSQKGVKSIQYPSGHSDTLEVAVRRATVTGVNQTALRLQDALADEMGCDLVETTAHAGARPEHAVWQGQIFSRSGKSDQYPDFVSSTGYGSGAGLGGWNCRHSFHPYFEGDPKAYSKKMLEGFEAKDYEYNGQKMTEYEATQQQRYVERQVRRWKRENAAMAAAGLDTSESASRIRQWQETQKDFLRQTGLKRQGDREQIATKVLANASGSGIIKTGGGRMTISSIDSPIEQRNTGRGKPGAILHYDVSLNNRQQILLDRMPEYDSRILVPKKSVGMVDLAALTAKTGDEFSMFTKGAERLIVRGDYVHVNITQREASKLAQDGYRWSGHTHPGTDYNCLGASDGDYQILKCFKQGSSAIYNSLGKHLQFSKEG